MRIQVGGGVAMMGIDPARASTDIDLFMEAIPDTVADAAARVAHAHGLHDAWLNNMPADMGLLPFDIEETPFFAAPRLVVDVVDSISMLLLRLHAGRDKDQQDIVALMRHTGLTSEAAVHSLIDEYAAEYPDAEIDVHWMKQHATEAALAVREELWGLRMPSAGDGNATPDVAAGPDYEP